jgi:hypothetical protein
LDVASRVVVTTFPLTERLAGAREMTRFPPELVATSTFLIVPSGERLMRLTVPSIAPVLSWTIKPVLRFAREATEVEPLRTLF